MEERVTSLFQPDTLLPDQYFDTFRRKLHLEPEKKLMLAILEDAVACYQKYAIVRDSKGQALFEEAEAWVHEKNANEIFSFDSVCEMLGFEPDYLRHGTGCMERPDARRTQPRKSLSTCASAQEKRAQWRRLCSLPAPATPGGGPLSKIGSQATIGGRRTPCLAVFFCC